MWFIKRLLCTFGIHWSGREGPEGMYGDCRFCDVCGEEAYDIFIIRLRKGEQDAP